MFTLPPKEEYNYGCLIKSERKRFDQWYEENYHTSFILSEELASYCLNDVDILANAVVQMQSLFRQITCLDIFQSKTIVSAVMTHLRTNHLPSSEHLALVTEKGYGFDRHFKQSTLARKYLAWYNHINGVELQTSETPGWEKKIADYYLDGFLESEDPNVRDKAVEVHGCFWHACPDHYPDDSMVVLDGKTAGFIRKRNKEREDVIRDCGVDLEIVWECQIKEELETNAEMRDFFDECFDSGAIKIRDAFFGMFQWIIHLTIHNRWTNLCGKNA